MPSEPTKRASKSNYPNNYRKLPNSITSGGERILSAGKFALHTQLQRGKSEKNRVLTNNQLTVRHATNHPPTHHSFCPLVENRFKDSHFSLNMCVWINEKHLKADFFIHNVCTQESFDQFQGASGVRNRQLENTHFSPIYNLWNGKWLFAHTHSTTPSQRRYDDCSWCVSSSSQ